MCVGPQTFVIFPSPNSSLGKILCFLPHTLISRTETRNYVGQFSVHILESDKMLGYWLSFLLIDLSGPFLSEENVTNLGSYEAIFTVLTR